LIKKLLIGILLLGIITIIGFFIFTANFEIFDKPKETYIKTECDYEGLRKVTMFELNGNATTNNSLLIKSSDCNVELYSDDLINSELIFSVTSPNIQRSDLDFKWKGFDTLTIIYKKDLQILKQEFESKTVNPKIIFEYKTDSIELKIGKSQQTGQKINKDWKHSEYFEFKNYDEYKITDTINIDLNGNGILEQIYFDNKDCPKLLIKEKGQDIISIGCGNEDYEGFPNAIGWVDLWCVVSDKETYEVIIKEGDILGDEIVSLERPSLFIGKEEAGGGIITYKNGKLYWVHQSD
jgi:hypothetical protein